MKIAFYTLGCKVNQYETQGLKEKFIARGDEVVGDLDYADVYVINTCTVTGLSDRKSRQYIRRTKRINPDSITAVIGCYAQISPEEVAAVEGVDIVAGTNEKHRLPEFVDELLSERKAAASGEGHGPCAGLPAGQPTGKAAEQAPEQAAGRRTGAAAGPLLHVLDYSQLTAYEETGIITSMESRTRAFIKIQEGCNRFCTYCVIPYARGTLRSRRREDILREAESLIARGFRELVLTGINTALYGMEPGFPEEEDGTRGVEVIIRELCALPGDFRIRLSSLEPTVVNAEYVAGLMKYDKLCRHLHLSLQSGSDSVLAAMNRRYDRAEYLRIVRALKDFDPNYGISTDIIVGFPGETESDFRDTLDMVEQAGFCKVHAFKYSRRKGTKAAEMKGQVAPEVKARRSAQLIEAGQLQARAFFRKNAGTVRRVLFEEFDEKTGYFRGHTDNFIEVYCGGPEDGTDLSNTFAHVRLTEPFAGGMKGVPVGK